MDFPAKLDCIHDAFSFMTEDEIREHMNSRVNGIADPVMSLFPDAMREMFPEATCVQVLRDPAKCIESMGQIVDAPITAIVLTMKQRLQRMAGSAFIMPFEGLDDGLERLCYNYIGAHYDKLRHDYFRNYNIQAHNIEERAKKADDSFIKQMIARQLEIENARTVLA
jgi:hypothetical protein